VATGIFDDLFADAAVQPVKLPTGRTSFGKEPLQSSLPSVGRLFITFIKNTERLQLCLSLSGYRGRDPQDVL